MILKELLLQLLALTWLNISSMYIPRMVSSLTGMNMNNRCVIMVKSNVFQIMDKTLSFEKKEHQQHVVILKRASTNLLFLTWASLAAK